MDWKDINKLKQNEIKETLRIDTRDFHYICIEDSNSKRDLEIHLNNKKFVKNIDSFVFTFEEILEIIKTWKAKNDNHYLSLLDANDNFIDLKYINIIKYEDKYLIQSGSYTRIHEEKIRDFINRDTIYMFKLFDINNL